MVPSIEQCHGFMARYEMLDNIRAHCMMVEKAARVIATELAEGGAPISIEVTTAGALLHDIAKTRCLKTGEDHAAVGRTMCIDNGLQEIADIVGEHVTLSSFDAEREVSEMEIVYYADKRVNHHHVVSLKARLAYLIGRYGTKGAPVRERIRKNIAMAGQVEKKLFASLTFHPEELGSRVEQVSLLD